MLNSKSIESRLFLRIYYVESQLNKWDFAKWAASRLQTGHSVDYQDLLVEYLSIGINSKKTFLEIGGCDGIYKSNCFTLEKNHWDGMVVEPNPLYHDDLTKNRTSVIIKAAITTKSQNLIVLVYDKNLPSSGSVHLSQFIDTGDLMKVEVPTIHINKLCEIWLGVFPQGPTYVSLDIEGLEELFVSPIMHQLKPKFFSIEHNNDYIKMQLIKDSMDFYSYREIFKNLTRNEIILTSKS